MNTTTQALNGKEIPHHNQDSARHPAKRLRPSHNNLFSYESAPHNQSEPKYRFEP